MMRSLVLLTLLAVPSARAEDAESPAARAEWTLKGCTIRSTTGPLETPIPPETAAALLDQPGLVAWLARRRKLARYEVEPRGPGRFWADDKDGTRGLATLIERRLDRRVYYAEGSHVSDVFPTIRAEAVVALAIEPLPRPGCAPGIRTNVEVCVRLRNPFLSGLVQLLQPFLRAAIARKFAVAFTATHRVGAHLAQEPEASAAEIRAFPTEDPAGREAAARLVEKLSRQGSACK